MRGFLALAIVAATCTSVAAALRAYTFDGATMAGGSLYGHPIGPNAPLTVNLVYDTAAAATNTSGINAVGYMQNIAYGLRLSIGDFELRANSYLLYVGNDVELPVGEQLIVVDRLSIAFGQQGLGPHPTLPLFVNGNATNDGFFSFDLVYAGLDTLQDSSLPPSLPSAGAFSPINGVGDAEPELPDVFFRLRDPVEYTLQPGDFNFDGMVTADDYAEWKAEFRNSGPSLADGNFDSLVGAADYTVWRDHFATADGELRAIGTSSTFAPEPNSATILAAFGICFRLLLCRLGRRPSSPGADRCR